MNVYSVGFVFDKKSIYRDFKLTKTVATKTAEEAIAVARRLTLKDWSHTRSSWVRVVNVSLVTALDN